MEYACQKLSLSQTGAFPELFLDYINQKPELAAFFNVYPVIENFKKLIDQKTFAKEQREILVKELKTQYLGFESQPDIDVLLHKNTFTVTTGHQLNILSGPLYIPFKIITIINLARELKKAYPEFNFVPVYWMASEDHDLEEIQSTRAFGKKIQWNIQQTGAVGPMHTAGLAELAGSLGAAADVFKKAYETNETLAAAVRAYMHELFGSYGLITIDADTRGFKNALIDVMKDDVLNHSAFGLVNESTAAIEAMGYKTPISAREINFFYLKEGIRERIVKEGDAYGVLNTEIRFTEEELLQEITETPERFSPNVVLRPLYEEIILPNLAYIGGPSEVPYWLQLKSIFDRYQVEFPALIPRNFALLLEEDHLAYCEKLAISPEQFFLPLHELQKNWVSANSQKELSLKDEMATLAALYAELKDKAFKIDVTLKPTAEAFEVKSKDMLERLEKKLMRAEKRNHKEALARIEKLKETLFPGGGLQERKENIIPFLEKHPNLIEGLISVLEPLEFQFNLIRISH